MVASGIRTSEAAGKSHVVQASDTTFVGSTFDRCRTEKEGSR